MKVDGMGIWLVVMRLSAILPAVAVFDNGSLDDRDA